MFQENLGSCWLAKKSEAALQCILYIFFDFRYGGKFGVQKDRMDKSAVDSTYKAKLAAHQSQTDAAKGFGGKYGVQKDRVDKVSYTPFSSVIFAFSKPTSIFAIMFTEFFQIF